MGVSALITCNAVLINISMKIHAAVSATLWLVFHIMSKMMLPASVFASVLALLA